VENLDRQTVLDLKSEDGGDLLVYGSLSVVNALTRQGLVDAFHLLVHPTFLGKGKPLFTDQEAMTLDIVSAHAFRSGVVLTRFRSRSSSEPGAEPLLA
jgi:dihydrofolate reductase